METALEQYRVSKRRTAFREGFREGYRQGMQEGRLRYGTMMEGTSIIIPTYNQLLFLKQCLDSIDKHTEPLHEIIVVDNASADGTADFLNSLGGKVRFRVLESNRGFAGAVNVGLMMAKGRTIVLLNNDTLVTHRWLDNMLRCLKSDPDIGAVGPVTNYISGDQRISVPYRKVEDMPAFARKHNRSDRSKWQITERLMGYCLLFRRELFESLGYFDEGFEVGNFEDDDYMVRTRMLGKTLVIARDTFIHHFGSVSIKAVGEPMNGINDRNHSFFLGKWNNPSEWILRVNRHPLAHDAALPHATALYPDLIAVQGAGPAVYWIENGQRRPVSGTLTFPPVRVAQVDLRRWPAGEPITAAEAEGQWRSPVSGVVRLRDGTPFHCEGNAARRIISEHALHAWNLHLKPVRTVSSVDIARMENGLPIVAPPRSHPSL